MTKFVLQIIEMFITITFISYIKGNILSIICITCDIIPIAVYIYIYLAEYVVSVFETEPNITTSSGTGNRLKMTIHVIGCSVHLDHSVHRVLSLGFLYHFFHAS